MDERLISLLGPRTMAMAVAPSAVPAWTLGQGVQAQLQKMLVLVPSSYQEAVVS